MRWPAKWKWKRKRKFTYAPLWANAVYALAEWLEYSVFDRLTSALTRWRVPFMDRHCKCEKCIERRKTGRIGMVADK